MRKLRKLLLPKGFYTSMFLLSVIILGVFSLFSALIAGSMAQRYEKAQYFKNYDYALRSISDTFAQKIVDFPNGIALKITGGTTRCNESLCRLLEARDYEEITPVQKNSSISFPFQTGYSLHIMKLPVCFLSVFSFPTLIV